VDLWSEDGKQEMNLVLHPTSADRYVPAQGPKTRKRMTARSNRQSDSATPTLASVTSSAAYNLRSHTEQPASWICFLSSYVSEQLIYAHDF
jgi:hypothetical protein